MFTISTLKLNYSPASVAHCRIQRPSAMQKNIHLPVCFTSTWLNRSKHISVNYQVHHKQMSKATESRVASLDESQVCDKDDSMAEGHDQVLVDAIGEYINNIRMMLSTIGEGRISVSPYDTAWVALIKDLDGRDVPQFPSCLEWIANNQLPDGSWGDEYFCAYDRLVNTLACVVALRTWNVHADKSEKGISFINENVYRLENEVAEHMTGGFEVIFPTLLKRAQNLGIDNLPYDDPVVRGIYDAREEKLKRIPMELVHKVPTALLYSLEGLEDLDWEKLLKLQETDGSFFSSPSSTAFAFMETKDENCLKFIKRTVEDFNGGAPHSHPSDLFARIWAVDRLQRLGISRFFESEIKDYLSHVYRFWTDKGIFSRREMNFADIDDTSMGFRLLRLHGYNVTPNVLRNFKQGNNFSCWPGQMFEAPSPIYNLYRASQLQFPGEQILEEAKNFSYKFLQERLAADHQLQDKWVISKHFHDEIRTGLEMPWYATLPRVEASFYLQHYSGAGDVWIAKTLNRMLDISNDTYLELARLDFKRCQVQHQIEWAHMQKWYETFNVQEFGISKKDLLVAYFVATASIFEPERLKERSAWVKTQIISKMISSFFNTYTTSMEQKTALLAEFNINGLDKTKSTKREQGLLNILITILHQLLEGFDRRISQQLKSAWAVWLMKVHQGVANGGDEAELLVNTLNICAGHIAHEEEILSQDEHKTLSKLTNKICQYLCEIQNKKVSEMDSGITTNSSIKDIQEVEQDMQALVQLVLEESAGGINRNIKQTFLLVAKALYYSAYHAAETIDMHIFKVLFEPVV